MKYQTAIDLLKNELKNARIHILAAAPSAPVSGQVYYDTTLTRLRVYDGTVWQDLTPQTYTDALKAGLDFKQSCRVATTANITLSGTQTIDTVAVVAGDRILVKNQTTGSENGIWVVASGAWTRATDADTNAKVTPGLFTFIEEGSASADSAWVLSTDAPITVGTTALTFIQFSGAGQITAGAGLTKSGNTLNVGQGAGIIVNADDVAVDTSVVARKYSATVGDGSATSFNIDHNLGTKDVQVGVRDTGTDEIVIADVVCSTVNRVVLTFAVAPASNGFRVAVIG